MTTKKIQSNDDLHLGLLRSLNANNSKRKNRIGGSSEEAEGSDTGIDKVNVELSKSINADLNPELMAAERREKVNRLKELVQSGRYNPKSEDIAAALGEEIVFEILSSKDQAVNE